MYKVLGSIPRTHRPKQTNKKSTNSFFEVIPNFVRIIPYTLNWTSSLSNLVVKDPMQDPG
jgi:hypothetical protein